MNKLSLIMAILIATLVFAPFLSACEEEHPEEVIHLTFGGLWPPTHPFSVATQEWIEKIELETDGWVEIEAFWGGALYGPRDSATELARGVADIGDYSGAYAAEGFDFEKSMRLAFQGVYDQDVIIKVWNEVLEKYPELEAEHADADIKVLCWGPIPPYQLVTVDDPVRTLDDFTGLVLKTTGDWAKLAAALAAEGTTISMGDTYTALEKNTIDGGFVPYETLKTFAFAEVVNYVTEINIAAAPAGHWGMCMETWNSLPDYIQEVFEDNIEWFSLKVAELSWAAEAGGIALAEAEGVEFITLSEADLEEIYAAADAVIRAEMAELDAMGLPGTEVYEEIRRLIEEYSD